MRFVILRAENKVVVDNAVASVDCSALPANVGIVVYQEVNGKLEYNDRPPLRTPFTDPSPYQALINSWINYFAAQTPPLTLAQARQVKSDLVEGIFHSKRRLPYTYNSWQYEATDEAVSNLDLLVQQTLTVSVTGTYTTAVNNALAQLTSDINTYIVNYNNTTAGNTNSWAGVMNTNWARVAKVGGSGADQLYVYVPGASPNFAPTYAGFGVMTALTAPTVTTPGSGSGSMTHSGNITYRPLNATAPQTIPATDAAAALTAIANRRNSLNSDRLSKQAAINALATIAAVVAYDATTGWSY